MLTWNDIMMSAFAVVDTSEHFDAVNSLARKLILQMIAVPAPEGASDYGHDERLSVLKRRRGGQNCVRHHPQQHVVQRDGQPGGGRRA